MIHYDELIKAEKMGYFSDYETLLFARAKGKIKSVTGVLPLTFTAKGGNAAGWTIYGNDDVGENLFDGTFVQGVWNSSTGQVPRILSSSTRLATSTMLAVDATETYNLKIFSATSDTLVLAIKLLNSAKEQISDTGWVGASASISGADYIVVNIRKFDESVITPADAAGITITKGSTAPDHYIPYQQGVGERTENLVEAKIANTNINNSGQIISNPDFAMWVVPVNQGVTYTFTTDGAVYAEYTEYPVLGSVAYNNKRVTATTTFTATIDGYIAFRSSSDYATAMCVIGSTAPTNYIPYGYQIPLTVSQQGQPDKTVDIYIGDSPLTEGETVSKTSTGQDIELFSGENTVDTSLYNKPEMKIDYK